MAAAREVKDPARAEGTLMPAESTLQPPEPPGLIGERG
jgi:hypothetical protein